MASTPAVRTVSVRAATLVGQPVSDVIVTLRTLGLQPDVKWIGGPAGTGRVVSVQPSGSVPDGSTVTVTAVRGS